MALKRTAREAFGKPAGQLSAFAAARQAKELSQTAAVPSIPNEIPLYSTKAEDFASSNRRYDRAIAEQITTGEDLPVITSLLKAPSTKPAACVLDQATVQCEDEQSLQLEVRIGEVIVVAGELDMQVTAGVISLYGALLTPRHGIQRVYAPSTQALPSIIGRREGTVVRIQSVRAGLAGLDRLSPMFRNIWATDEVTRRSFVALTAAGANESQHPLNLLEIDDDTKKVLSRLNARYEDGNERPIIMAIGGKSVGKSTFNRLLCNMIHCRWSAQSCLYLDLDPGQPEFGPPGQVSLVEVKAPILGPSFSHPADISSPAFRLVRAHTLAALTFKDEPDHYLACALDLFQHACASAASRQLPVVINSAGWVTGLGASTLLQLAQSMHVTDIVQLGPVSDGVAEELAAAQTRALHSVARRTVRPAPRAPAELRAMQTMAYFHHRQRRHRSPATALVPDSSAALSSCTSTWTRKPLSAFRPWEVSYAGEASGIRAVLSYGQSPDAEFLAEVLDGAVVAVVAVRADALDGTVVRRTRGEGLPFVAPDARGLAAAPLDPARSTCVGLALVRGIDVRTQRLLLVVAPASALATARWAGSGDLCGMEIVLVRGGFESPDWAYLEDLHVGGAAEYGELGGSAMRPWVTRREHVGVEGAVWRLRHPPVSLAGTR